MDSVISVFPVLSLVLSLVVSLVIFKGRITAANKVGTNFVSKDVSDTN